MLKFKNRSLLKLLDFSSEEINYLLNLAAKLKKEKYEKTEKQLLKNKNIALIFEKDSTRTRCAFEVAAYDQGMHVTYLGSQGSQMNKKETIADTARVLCRMYDGIQFRGYKQSDVESLAKYANVPVWNGLTNEFHPTQILADFLTIIEHKKKLKDIKLVFLGDARNNVANSLMIGCAKMGMHFVACAPESLQPNKELVNQAKEIAKENGATITIEADVMKATKDADVLYTDVWVSMGEPENIWEERIQLLKNYQVNMNIIKNSKSDVIFLHCLPSFHNDETEVGQKIKEKFNISEMEVTNEVFENKSISKVFDEAENRLHTIKAIMVATLS